MTAARMNLNQLAEYLREHGVPDATVGTTGGNCHSVVIPLPDGGEILVGDYEGPMASGEDPIDGIVVLGYGAEFVPWTTEHGDEGVIWESPTPISDDIWRDARDATAALVNTLADIKN